MTCHDFLHVEGVKDLFKEWEDKLAAEGLTVDAGKHNRSLQYSSDPENFPKKYIKRDWTWRRRAKFIRLCPCGCGRKFTGNAKRVAFDASCRKRIQRSKVTISCTLVSEDINGR